MEIDETPTWIRIQKPCIARWTITKGKQLMKINLGSEKNLQSLIEINQNVTSPFTSYMRLVVVCD
jgi:hypothetical protein